MYHGVCVVFSFVPVEEILQLLDNYMLLLC